MRLNYVTITAMLQGLKEKQWQRQWHPVINNKMFTFYYVIAEVILL